jgi:hypothetical protein
MLIDLKTVPAYAKKAPSQIVWTGAPLPWKAHCLDSQGYFSQGELTETELEIQIFDFVWGNDEDQHRRYIDVFGLVDRRVSSITLRGESTIEFQIFLSALEEMGLELRAVRTKLSFKHREALVDGVRQGYYTVYAAGCEIVTQPELQALIDWQDFGSFQVLGVPREF